VLTLIILIRGLSIEWADCGGDGESRERERKIQIMQKERIFCSSLLDFVENYWKSSERLPNHKILWQSLEIPNIFYRYTFPEVTDTFIRARPPSKISFLCAFLKNILTIFFALNQRPSRAPFGRHFHRFHSQRIHCRSRRIHCR
jgi:hypothetical protein